MASKTPEEMQEEMDQAIEESRRSGEDRKIRDAIRDRAAEQDKTGENQRSGRKELDSWLNRTKKRDDKPRG